MEGCRPATRDDLDLIVTMARALRDEITPLRGAKIWEGHEGRRPPLAESYAGLLDRPDACVLVGTIDDVVLGFGVCEIDELHDGARLGVLSDLYVEPEAREIGVGEAIVEAVVAWCSERGCTGIDAWALPGHRMTKNFFEEHGFVSRLIVAHRRLADEPPPETES